MPSPQTQILRLPGKETRELWLSDGAGSWRLAGEDDGRQGGVWAIECLAVDSAPFWTASSSITGSSLDDTASLHWEALGLGPDEAEGSWTCWEIEEAQGKVLAGTAALAAGASDPALNAVMPDAFDLSARYYPIPSGEGALWKELGRYALAFTRGTELLHMTVLQNRVLDADAAWEIRDMALALEVRGFLNKVERLHVWAPAGEDFISELQSAVGCRALVGNRPLPRPPRQGAGLLPPEVARRRKARTRRRLLARLTMAASLAYLLFFGAWAGWLLLRERKIDAEAAHLAKLNPQVESVRNAQRRWYALEAATDPTLYATEVFHQVVSLLPPEGIRLLDFTMDGEKLVVGGEASSPGVALKFKSDVESNEGLKRYAWSFPQPTVLEDNRARFRAEGTLAGGLSQ